MYEETTSNLPPMSNREMAALLFNIATCLREAGNMNRWRTEAYERGARALMALDTPVSAILETEKVVPFRRRQHIGRKLQAKIREMVSTGQLDQYLQLLAEMPPHRAELMRVPGIGPKTADQIHERLGISTQSALVQAARDGSLRAVPGFGPKRMAQIAHLPIAAPEWDLFHLAQ